VGIIDLGHIHVNNVAAPYTREWNKQLASWEDQADAQLASSIIS